MPMSFEDIGVYVFIIGVVGILGSMVVETVERKCNEIEKRDSKTQSEDVIPKTEYACKGLCLDYKLKWSCRHLSQ